MREEIPHENELKHHNSLKAIRSLAVKIPEVRQEVLQSVKPCMEPLLTMIQRLKLKDHQFGTGEAATDEEMEALWNEVLKVQTIKHL